jgi:hypothetical protein
MKTRILCFFLLSCLITLSAAARPMVGVTGTNDLIRFDSATPGTITSSLPIAGLSGDVLQGIDFRPANGVLYALGINGTVGRIYTINLATGAATLVSTAPFFSNLTANASYGFDIDPATDSIRLVTSFQENIRFDPDKGSFSLRDTDITPAADQVVGLAYDRSDRNPLTGTTLFGIDFEHDMLVRIGGVNGSPSPNLGVATNIGSTGLFTTTNNIGFDIAEDGVAYASMGTGAGTPTYKLYTITLSSGAATVVGNIGAGTTVIRGIAAIPSAVANIDTGKFFTTIQGAVNDGATLNGHTIAVNAGTFSEIVTVNKSLTFLGAKSGVDARDSSRGTLESVVRGALVGGGQTTSFNVTANGVTIDGFTVQDNTNANQFGFGIVLGPGTSGSKIRNNIIQNNIAGLSLANASPSNRR